jgi:threonine/homoserine/homoserine lactone efflux protein
VTPDLLLPALIKGLVLGLSIAAPVGPIALLCLRRTIESGFAAGFAGGLGTATADALYGGVAAFGLTAVWAFLVSQEAMLRLAGGVFLLWFGASILRSRPAERAAAVRTGGGLAVAYLQTFALTLTNPMTILAVAAAVTGLGLAGGAGDGGGAAVGYGPATALVAGVFLGSTLWWALLSGAVSLGRRRMTGRALLRINRAAGLVLMGFGAHLVLGLLR